MDLTNIFDYEKIIIKVGRFSPIFIYAWLLYITKGSILFVILLAISIILSLLFIIIKDIFIEEYGVKERKTLQLTKEFVEKIKSSLSKVIIHSIFVWLMLINLGIATFFSIKYTISNFSLIIFILDIISSSTFLYLIFLILFSRKAFVSLSKYLKKKPEDRIR